MDPWANNPLRSREDFQRAMIDLFEPLAPAYRAGGARVSLGKTATVYDRVTADLETFSRPLWGIVPLAAGGAPFAHWDLIHTGLARGTNPADAQYWKAVGDTQVAADQREVEMAPMGLGLALIPQFFFDPLPAAARDHLIAWLDSINHHPLAPNNWQFFRVLVNLGFAQIGAPVNQKAMDESLELIDSYWVGDGWYQDGKIANTDFYNPWALHFYGLIYATLHGAQDPERAARFRERARRFATDWETRFDGAGRVIPFGRSLTYRFGSAAFWGALAFAGEEALPWGQIHGLWAKHMRSWLGKPIWRPDGALSIGWSYPNLLMSETYNGPGSPYWALKACLPLALAADHPFWATPEDESAGAAPRQVAQVPARAYVSRDEQQAQMLNGGRGIWFMRHGPAKYGKFAYSSAFGFSLDPDDPLFTLQPSGDSMLYLTTEDGVTRGRTSVVASGVDGDVVWSRWQPFTDVTVTTVLCGQTPWHARIHHIVTGRPLDTFEAGFAVGSDGDPADAVDAGSGADGAPRAVARARTAWGASVIGEVGAGRQAVVRALQPNTNLIYPRAVAPGLTGKLAIGRHTLACVVAAVEPPRDLSAADLPAIPDRAWQTLSAHAGEEVKPIGGV